jgi:hypothetical protein
MKQLPIFKPINPLNKAKIELDTLIKNPLTSNLLKWNLILLAVIWLLYAIAYQFLPPEIPLLYSLPWGQDQLVKKSFLLFLPISASILSIINIRLSSLALNKETLLTLIILWVQVVCNLLIIISLLKTIFLLM